MCVNLDRRHDRWERFEQACPIDCERVQAVDGKMAKPPKWWRQGGGAWGCMATHIRILEQAIMDGMRERGEVLLVFEDDALFPPDFEAKLQRFTDALPDDWDQVYLGGQHRSLRTRPPKRVNDEVVRCFQVNRTHAYAVRGKFLLPLYRHLCDWPSHAKHPRHHVDHRMELLHIGGRFNIYAPTDWIVGQAGGKSDINGRIAQDRYWPSGQGKPRAAARPPVWVIGLHRSGSSVTAGILHRLGVHMGNRLGGFENRGTGGFEAHGLATICEDAYPFPATEAAVPASQTKAALRSWIDARKREAGWRGTVAGGKYPHLCFLIEMLLELEPESRFIHIERPIEESIASLTSRSARAHKSIQATPSECERLQRSLWQAKERMLPQIPGDRLLTIQHGALMSSPAVEVDRVIGFLGLKVRPEQRQQAIELVEPSRAKHSAA